MVTCHPRQTSTPALTSSTDLHLTATKTATIREKSLLYLPPHRRPRTRITISQLFKNFGSTWSHANMPYSVQIPAVIQKAHSKGARIRADKRTRFSQSSASKVNCVSAISTPTSSVSFSAIPAIPHTSLPPDHLVST